MGGCAVCQKCCRGKLCFEELGFCGHMIFPLLTAWGCQKCRLSKFCWIGINSFGILVVCVYVVLFGLSAWLLLFQGRLLGQLCTGDLWSPVSICPRYVLFLYFLGFSLYLFISDCVFDEVANFIVYFRSVCFISVCAS